MPTLSEAITAIRAGRINDARFMLTRILATDGNNITALLWMTEVAQTPEELRTYLERVLAIDPTNAPARRGLELLDKANEQPPLVATDQLSPNQPATTSTASDHQRMSPDESKPQRSTKVCPFCWKTISADSSTCRFCGHELTVTTKPALVKVSTPKAKWTTPQFIFLAAILVLVASMVVVVVSSAVSRSQLKQPTIAEPTAAKSQVQKLPSQTECPMANEQPQSEPPSQAECQVFRDWYRKSESNISALKFCRRIPTV